MIEDRDFQITPDKLTESYSLRIPAITKEMIERLPKRFKKVLNEEILLVIARVLHDSRFDPNFYLASKEE